jgi:mannan endo-1,4-beta-mannosidase
MTKYLNIFLLLLVFFASCKKEDKADITPPQVISTQPVNGAADVPKSTEIIVEFDEDINFVANYQITVNGIAKTISKIGRKIKINTVLAPNTVYTITISGNSIKDLAGNFASEYSFSFTTEPAAPFNLSANLVSPNPSTQAVKLFNFLKENFQSKILSGTMAAHSTNINEATWVHDQTGKWPALTCFDFIDHPNLINGAGWVLYDAPLTLGTDWWNNNGIVAIMWHWRDPLTKTGGFYSPGSGTPSTTFDVSKISNTASPEYAAMIEDIDTIAGYLREFRDAGIPVIWRPLHEAAGTWFWWGAKGAAPCKALWLLMFDRLVNYHGLNNLIWVWTSNTEADALNWYPGDEYVDIIGMDIYPGTDQHGSQITQFNSVKEIFSSKKMITLSECGSVPDPALMMQNGDTWMWFMPWNGDYTRSTSHNGPAWWNTFFSYNFVITRDMMPDLH